MYAPTTTKISVGTMRHVFTLTEVSGVASYQHRATIHPTSMLNFGQAHDEHMRPRSPAQFLAHASPSHMSEAMVKTLTLIPWSLDEDPERALYGPS